jgi:hypothetical protein
MPSNPSPEEREARKAMRHTLSVQGGCIGTDECLHCRRAMDTYAQAVYERGVRDGLTSLAAESEDGTYVFGTEEIIRFRDSLRTHLATAASVTDIRTAVEGAMCYDCGCESVGPWKCERVIVALGGRERNNHHQK